MTNDIGNDIRATLYWNPTPGFGKMGGTGTWSNDPNDKRWSEDNDHRDDNVAFSSFDNVIFPRNDAFGEITLTSVAQVTDQILAGDIGGSKGALIESRVGGSLAIASGATVSHSDLTLDGVLGGDSAFDVTGGITLTGLTPFTGSMRVLEGGGVNILGIMPGGPDFDILDGRVDVGAGGQVTGAKVTIDTTGQGASDRARFVIEGDEDEPTPTATFSGRINMTGDNTGFSVDEFGTATATGATLVSGGAGSQGVDIEGSEAGAASMTGAIRLGDDNDSFEIYAAEATGFVNMGDGRDYVNVGGDEDDGDGVLNGNVQFGGGADDLSIDEMGLIRGNVAMGADNDEVDIYGGTLAGALRLGTGNDAVTLHDPGSVITGKVLAQGGDDEIAVEEGSITASVVLGSGNDSLLVDPGASVAGRILAGGGDDTVQGGDGDDRIFGSRGADSLSGGADNDRLIGNGDNDTLKGEAGQDVLIGGGGDDLLEGGSQADRLDGGAGNDTLDGGTGGDQMTGGTGADRFVFSEIWVNGPGEDDDQILDFSASDGDRIDLSGIDAITATAGDDAFTFTDSFSGTAGELIAEGTPGGLYVRGDVDGDGVGDLEIFMAGTSELFAGDFLL